MRRGAAQCEALRRFPAGAKAGAEKQSGVDRRVPPHSESTNPPRFRGGFYCKWRLTPGRQVLYYAPLFT